jgi:hypothetical protein
MGNAGVALADNASAVFWNPAGLAAQRGTEISFTHSNWLPSSSPTSSTSTSWASTTSRGSGRSAGTSPSSTSGSRSGATTRTCCWGRSAPTTSPWAPRPHATSRTVRPRVGASVHLLEPLRRRLHRRATRSRDEGGRLRSGRPRRALHVLPVTPGGVRSRRASGSTSPTWARHRVHHRRRRPQRPDPHERPLRRRPQRPPRRVQPGELRGGLRQDPRGLRRGGEPSFYEAIFSSWKPIRVCRTAPRGPRRPRRWRRSAIIRQITVGTGLEYWYNDLFARAVGSSTRTRTTATGSSSPSGRASGTTSSGWTSPTSSRSRRTPRWRTAPLLGPAQHAALRERPPGGGASASGARLRANLFGGSRSIRGAARLRIPPRPRMPDLPALLAFSLLLLAFVGWGRGCGPGAGWARRPRAGWCTC